MSETTKMIQLICDEKDLQYDVVMDAVETALGAAFRKDFGNRQQNIKIKFDPETSDIKAWDVKEVVEDVDEEILEADQDKLAERREQAHKEGRELSEEEVDDLARFNPKTQIMMKEAKEVKKDAKLGEILEITLEVPGDFGRMAAQTAKQVIIQKLREAERNNVFEGFKDQAGKIVQGVVHRREKNGTVMIDLGKINGVLPASEQVRSDQYRPGAKMKFYVSKVQMSDRGPEIILSRSDKRIVAVIFTEEIPEIEAGTVVIKAIARDAGNRSKVAVATDDDTIDPIGSCIGQRGSRINTIIEGLGGEKIDVIQYSEDSVEFIKNSLSPAKVTAVKLDEKEMKATVVVAGDQFSLAIGRGGQNVRLATTLTGWTINVVQESEEGEIIAEVKGVDYSKMKIAELKELLKEKDLLITGKKGELIERLHEATKEQSEEAIVMIGDR